MFVVHDVALLPARPAVGTQEAQGTIIVIREKHVRALQSNPDLFPSGQ